MREDTWFEASVNLMVGVETREEPFIALPLHPPLAHIRRPCEVPLLARPPGAGSEKQGRGRLISLFLSSLILGFFHPVGFTWTESNIS